MQTRDSNWRSWLADILVFAAPYATVRYHFAQQEPWSRFYFWTVNKAISFAAAAPVLRWLVQRKGIAHG